MKKRSVKPMENKRSKAGLILEILFWIDAIAIIAFAVTFPIDGFMKVIWKVAVLAALIVLLFLFAVIGFEARRKFRNKLLLEYVPLRNIQIEKGKEYVLLQDGVRLDKEKANTEVNGTTKVALIHIDEVENTKTTIRLFKDKVAIIDVAHYVNKN